MPHARSTPLVASRSRVHRQRFLSVVVFAAVVGSTSVSLTGAVRPAAADQVSDLQTEAAVVSQQLIRGQLQVEAYQQQVSVAAARVDTDGRAVAQLGQQITRDQQLTAAKADQVRRLAIQSYIDYGTGVSSADMALFDGTQEHVQVASEYSAIAVGDISTALSQLRAAQRVVQDHQMELQHQLGQDRTDQARQVAFLAQADDTQHQVQVLQSRVTGQLAAAVTAQSAAQDAAAAAAVAAAQRSATKAPVVTSPPTVTASSPSAASGTPVAPAATTPVATTPTPTAPGPAGGTAGGTADTVDPVLNPFLQCVVQAESGGDYAAVSPDGLYMGAFQFSQPTWNTAAMAAGRPDLVGIPPNRASKADQDTVAVALYSLDGQQPWLGDRCTN